MQKHNNLFMIVTLGYLWKGFLWGRGQTAQYLTVMFCEDSCVCNSEKKKPPVSQWIHFASISVSMKALSLLFQSETLYTHTHMFVKLHTFPLQNVSSRASLKASFHTFLPKDFCTMAVSFLQCSFHID